jgi:glycosyltransferase involved in cell wall biosynthesis
MKICLISPLFDPWLIGGAERYVTTLAYALSDYHEVIVITTIGPKNRANNSPKCNLKVIETGTKNVCSVYDIIHNSSSIGIARKSLWHFLDLWNIFAFKQIEKILCKEKPDLVHTNGVIGFSSSLFSAIKKHSQIPHIYTLHDYQLISRWSSLFRMGKPISQFNFLDRMYMSYMRKISSSVHTVISPSKFLIDYHSKLGFFINSKKYVVPNGIKLHNDIVPREHSGSEFLFIGQITEHKGLQIAIEAFKKLKEKNAKLHIVGEGPYIKIAKQMSEGDSRVVFHGFVESKIELDEIFKRCSYAIVPSIWYEIFGLVIIECFDRGLPVIASNIGAIPELIQDRYNGFLFQPGDIDSLHNIVSNLLNRKELLPTLSKNAIESSKRFSIEKHMNNIMDIYNSTIRTAGKK